mgnify:FL=1|jgi:hypothetical protein|tara:strand:+ start:1161 stop:1538 length:378 start_codon:yes stop_codon:yes gene_type:complete
MANTNLTGNGTLVFNSRLWGGVGEDDTNWLQSPIGSNSATGTISLGIVDVTVTDGDAAFAYDLALATNAISGSSLVGVLGAHNTTTAGGNAFTVAGNVSTNTLIKLTPASAGQDGDVVRITFLYR